MCHGVRIQVVRGRKTRANTFEEGFFSLHEIIFLLSFRFLVFRFRFRLLESYSFSVSCYLLQ